MFAIALNPFSHGNVKIASNAIQRHATHQISPFSQGNSWIFMLVLIHQMSTFSNGFMCCAKQVTQKYLSFKDMAGYSFGADAARTKG